MELAHTIGTWLGGRAIGCRVRPGLLAVISELLKELEATPA
jgi:hypothetical protein